MYQLAKYIGQRSFSSKVIIPTHKLTHTDPRNQCHVGVIFGGTGLDLYLDSAGASGELGGPAPTRIIAPWARLWPGFFSDVSLAVCP